MIMKENELMLGDWVYWRNLPIKLTRKDFHEPVRNEEMYELDFFDTIKPIPLTEDILKANGFIKVHHAGTGATEEYDDYITNGFLCRHTTEDWKDTHFCIPDTGLQLLYVHELQHVLRLCRLGGADNFKIE